jgi:sec-independent protein translocase protein TatC
VTTHPADDQRTTIPAGEPIGANPIGTHPIGTPPPAADGSAAHDVDLHGTTANGAAPNGAAAAPSIDSMTGQVSTSLDAVASEDTTTLAPVATVGDSATATADSATATLPPAVTDPLPMTTPVVESPIGGDASGPPAVPPSEPPTGYASPAPAPEEEEEDGMTMLEHLEELRVRLIVCAVAVAVGLLVSAVPLPFLTQIEGLGIASVSATVMDMIARPAAGYLIYLKPGEGFVTYLQVAMLIGFALAMPVVLYQVIAFVLPALLPHEKKYLYMSIPGAMISFLIGITFGYVLVLPVAIEFLKTFSPLAPGVVAVQWAFSEYIGTVTSLLFYMGIAFELPLLMFFLTKLRIINPVRLAGFRKYALILAFVIGAMITPTPDPLNQTIVSLPIYLLFELGLLLSKLA